MSPPSDDNDIALIAGLRKAGQRQERLESASVANYQRRMPERDLGLLLGNALRVIRKRTVGTQERWTQRTGMSQSYLSAVERGEAGWEALRTIGSAVARVGVDPADLLRIALTTAQLDEEDAELAALWHTAAPSVRAAILTLLRSQVSADVRAAGR